MRMTVKLKYLLKFEYSETLTQKSPPVALSLSRSRIHEHIISLKVSGDNLESSHYKTCSIKPLLLKGGGGVKSNSIGVTVNSKVETLKTFVPIKSKNWASGKSGLYLVFTSPEHPP
jgi:hypothetical protein